MSHQINRQPVITSSWLGLFCVGCWNEWEAQRHNTYCRIQCFGGGNKVNFLRRPSDDWEFCWIGLFLFHSPTLIWKSHILFRRLLVSPSSWTAQTQYCNLFLWVLIKREKRLTLSLVFLSPLALWPGNAVRYLAKEKLRPPLLHSCHSSLLLSSPNYELETRSESWSPQGVCAAQHVCSSEVQPLATRVLRHMWAEIQKREWGSPIGVLVQWSLAQTDTDLGSSSTVWCGCRTRGCVVRTGYRTSNMVARWFSSKS